VEDDVEISRPGPARALPDHELLAATAYLDVVLDVLTLLTAALEKTGVEHISLSTIEEMANILIFLAFIASRNRTLHA
jgi:hypothetical protein